MSVALLLPAPVLAEIFVGKVQTLESDLPEDLSLLP